MSKDFVDIVQAYVDAALAECCIRNHGKGRCKVREDEKGRGFCWVRVHGECADPEGFAVKLRRVAHNAIVKKVELNGSGRYVKVWPL